MEAIGHYAKAYENENVVYESDEVPLQMNANAVIQFIDSSHYIILEEGTPLSEEEKAEVEREILENLIFVAEGSGMTPEELEANRDNPFEVINPGLIIIYGDDGCVYRAENDSKPVTYKYSIKGGTWGTNNTNTVTVNSKKTSVSGKGRATVFKDEIGQADHTLKKGDIATSLAYDNCRVGVAVKVTMKTKSGESKTVGMKKWDAGGLPDAVVDIWKTGVEYWGYTYSNTWSKKGASYKHDYDIG